MKEIYQKWGRLTQGLSAMAALKGGFVSPPYSSIWFSTEPPPAEPPMIVTLAGSPVQGAISILKLDRC
jgi:hypothetical protein